MCYPGTKKGLLAQSQTDTFTRGIYKARDRTGGGGLDLNLEGVSGSQAHRVTVAVQVLGGRERLLGTASAQAAWQEEGSRADEMAQWAKVLAV